MQRRVIARLAVGTGILCLVGSGSLVWYGSGWAASDWLGFGSSILIEIGAALFLVPAILWLERRLAKNIEDAQRSITARYLDSSGVNLLGPNSSWQQVHSEFARLGVLYPTERIELRYPTFYLQFQPQITFSTETVQPGSQVFLFFNATGQDEDLKVLLWLDGVSGEDFVALVRRALIATGVFPPHFPTDQDFFADLRRVILDIPRRHREDHVTRRRERQQQKKS